MRATRRSRRSSHRTSWSIRILKADNEAVGSSDTYDEIYFEKFFAQGPADPRAAAVRSHHRDGSIIVSAWDQAGRPTLRMADARPVEKVARHDDRCICWLSAAIASSCTRNRRRSLARRRRPGAGRLRHWAHAAYVRWHGLVESARRRTSTGRVAQWRDGVVRRLAETIAEQRTLWALAEQTPATLRFPASVGDRDARAALDRALVRAPSSSRLVARRRRAALCRVGHADLGPRTESCWPTTLAFRLVGHWLSWRGARHAVTDVQWTLEPDGNLAELASLVDVPRATRARPVDAIAARLNLHRLSTFFERVAA